MGEEDFDEIEACWESQSRLLRLGFLANDQRPTTGFSEHPLAQEQQHGISYQLAMERASLYLHHRRTFH
jgi:hypothetical protein